MSGESVLAIVLLLVAGYTTLGVLISRREVRRLWRVLQEQEQDFERVLEILGGQFEARTLRLLHELQVPHRKPSGSQRLRDYAREHGIELPEREPWFPTTCPAPSGSLAQLPPGGG